jgi:hypothetical protein
VEQKLPTLPEHLRSLPDFSGVRVTRSFALYVCFVMNEERTGSVYDKWNISVVIGDTDIP